MSPYKFERNQLVLGRNTLSRLLSLRGSSNLGVSPPHTGPWRPEHPIRANVKTIITV